MLQLLVGARVILYLTISSTPVTKVQCRHNGFGQDNCGHDEDVRVICCINTHRFECIDDFQAKKPRKEIVF